MNKFLHLFVALVVIMFAAPSPAISDDADTLRKKVGVWVNYGLGLHTASFSQLGDVANCCPEFTGGSGSAMFFGLTYEHPLSRVLRLDVRFFFNTFKSNFSVDERKSVLTQDLTPRDATITHTLDGTFSMGALEPLVTYTLDPGINVHGGMTAGYLFHGDFEQREKLTQPSGAQFVDVGSNERNYVNGSIPGLSSLQLGITIGASTDLALNESRTIYLVPQVFYTHSVMPIAANSSWLANHLRFGLGLSFVPPEPEEDTLSLPELYDFARKLRQKTPTETGYPLSVSVTASGILADGSISQGGASVGVEQFESRRVRPLLPYIFFDPGSSTVPETYRRLSSTAVDLFSMDNFYNLDALYTYSHILNIIGKRLSEIPNATITLTGCTDNTGVEENNTVLARERASTVAKYLTSTWKVDPQRITVVAHGIPAQASNNSTDDGMAENRRVEITASDSRILGAVDSKDTLRVFNPAGIRFSPTVTPHTPLSQWTLFVTANDRIIKVFHDNAPVPSYLDWRIDEQTNFIPNGTSSIEYLFVAQDTAGKIIPSANRVLELREITLEDKRSKFLSDKSIDRYSMILFGFDKSDLSNTNMELINQIKSKIRANSIVNVYGYTDRSGDADYNVRLSRQRALSVSKALGIPDSSAHGLGKTLSLYDNNTPAGRFYSRTVEVLVETPVQ